MNLSKIVVALLFASLVSFGGKAQEVNPKVKEEIQHQIDNLRTAHLNSDVALAGKLYHPDLILTSQSGTKYDKEVAVTNIKNTFESYESSDIQFLHVADDVILTNYINERKYKDFDKGIYRLTVVWTKLEGEWTIISMQSSKVKTKK